MEWLMEMFNSVFRLYMSWVRNSRNASDRWIASYQCINFLLHSFAAFTSACWTFQINYCIKPLFLGKVQYIDLLVKKSEDPVPHGSYCHEIQHSNPHSPSYTFSDLILLCKECEHAFTFTWNIRFRAQLNLLALMKVLGTSNCWKGSLRMQVCCCFLSNMWWMASATTADIGSHAQTFVSLSQRKEGMMIPVLTIWYKFSNFYWWKLTFLFLYPSTATSGAISC